MHLIEQGHTLNLAEAGEAWQAIQGLCLVLRGRMIHG
jgi:hypothetical protein